jgi:VWFA-related protein
MTRRGTAILTSLAALLMRAQPEQTLRVTVNLVQVDATVTDAKGNPIPDLKPGDFRVLLDRKPQELKFSDYVRLRELPSAGKTQTDAAIPREQISKPARPAATLKREQVRRTIVLFVADLLTSAESMPGIQAGLRKFVQEQVQPGDLVAIVRSSAGLGALQDFTPDKHMLLAAIDQVRWTPNAIGIGGASAYTPIVTGTAPVAPDLDQAGTINTIERATLATTSSLLRVVRGMADLPGRKSVILVSDALRLTLPDELDPSGQRAIGTGAFVAPIYQSMRRVVDESVRAGVVLYAIDTRGISSLRATASDHLDPIQRAGGGGRPNVSYGAGDSVGSNWVTDQTLSRRNEYKDNQWGSLFVSSQTGGFMITESNRLDDGLARIMEDQRGYYVLAFQPPAEAMQTDLSGQPVFHKLKIEVTRPGVQVRSSAGFFGVPDQERRVAGRPELQLMESLDSPFQASGIAMEVETSYLSGRNEYFLRATLYIDGKDVEFTGPPIHRTGLVHVILRTFNATGITLEGGIDQMRRIDLNEEGYQRALKYGLIYSTLLPVKKPGPYQVRAAVRDEATGKIGTAGDFVVIPNPKEKGVRLSGIVFQHALGTDGHVVPAAGPNLYSSGQSAPFAVQIVAGGNSWKPVGLAMRLHLFRDGVEAWKSAPIPVETGPQESKTEMFLAKGSITIPKGLEPGKYLLRVDLCDQAQPDTVTAWQWAKLTVK